MGRVVRVSDFALAKNSRCVRCSTMRSQVHGHSSKDFNVELIVSQQFDPLERIPDEQFHEFENTGCDVLHF